MEQAGANCNGKSRTATGKKKISLWIFFASIPSLLQNWKKRMLEIFMRTVCDSGSKYEKNFTFPTHPKTFHSCYYYYYKTCNNKTHLWLSKVYYDSMLMPAHWLKFHRIQKLVVRVWNPPHRKFLEKNILLMVTRSSWELNIESWWPSGYSEPNEFNQWTSDQWLVTGLHHVRLSSLTHPKIKPKSLSKSPIK